MMQSLILPIAVVLLWLAIAGEAEQCLVKFLKDDIAQSPLAFLTWNLSPHSGFTCDSLRSPHMLFNVMHYAANDDTAFEIARIEYFRQQSPSVSIVTANRDYMLEFLGDWQWYAWQYDREIIDDIVFKESDTPLQGIRQWLFEIAFEDKRGRSSVAGGMPWADYSQKPSPVSTASHGYVIQISLNGDLYIFALFNLKKELNSRTRTAEIWQHASRNSPVALFVQFPHIDWQIEAFYWFEFVDRLTGFARLRFSPKVYLGHTCYQMDFFILAEWTDALDNLTAKWVKSRSRVTSRMTSRELSAMSPADLSKMAVSSSKTVPSSKSATSSSWKKSRPG